ncbi:isocitrate lyase/PEP mutase family protein [Sphingomonas sp. DT-204]|uniref:isocitrate lyase/PEP mutase family protein n=1 Tax=Sphingomonas sp. DT-204 TaxID=3396166 RepID=UPI003F1D0FA0
MSKFQQFTALHAAGTPLVLFNAWDAGSARAVARAGAQAIATGSWSVADAHGYADGEGLPVELVIANAARIVSAVDLPVTVDFEAGYAADLEDLAANFIALAATGAIGCNFEDGLAGDGLRPAADHAARIAVAREAAGADFFINARTDIFLQAKPDTHDTAKVDDAIARAHAYAEAGANGFFVPGLVDLDLLARVCRESPLPVNAMTWPGAPSNAEFAAAGVARISYGPGPYRVAMQAVEDAARAIYAG